MYQKPALTSITIDQGVQIFIPPKSLASVPESIGTPSDNILHWLKWPGFVVYYVNCRGSTKNLKERKP